MSARELVKNVKGFSRVQIVEEVPVEGYERKGNVLIPNKFKIVGDSGLVGPNQITDDGFLNYLVNLLAGTTGSLQVTHIALGTGGAPAAGATALAGEISGSTERKAIAMAAIGNTTAQFTATFASADSFLAGASNLSNIGLFAHSSSNNLFAGNTYASSSCNTNQSVNVTYQIRFS